MLDEAYYLEYEARVLEDMPEERGKVFRGPLRKYAISTTRVRHLGIIRFAFYQDHFLEAVAKWPWLLCRNLGEHLLKAKAGRTMSYDDELVNNVIYGVNPPWKP